MAYVFAGRSSGEAFAIDKEGNVWSWGLNQDRSYGVGLLGRPDLPLGQYGAPGIVWAAGDGGKALGVAYVWGNTLIVTEEMLWAYTAFISPWVPRKSPTRVPQTEPSPTF
jgi:hypothetical protein